MDGFFLLLGHLCGDFLLQTDWQARWKGARSGTVTPEEHARVMETYGHPGAHRVSWLEWRFTARPAFACTLHCALYTLAVWVCACWWLPWWGAALCFALHWPLDRYRLARRWMAVVGQEAFATGPLAPWSVVVVDNTLHLAALGGLAILAGRVG